MRRSILSATLMVVAASAPTAEGADAPGRRAITLDDYFTLAYLPEQAISPDGRLVAYAEARWQEATNDRKADLWVAETKPGAGPPTRLTFDRPGCRDHRWGPDGQNIYFLAARRRDGAAGPPFDGKTQVWRVPIGGGEPTPVTQVPGGVVLYDVAGDGRTLFYATSRQEAAGDWTALRQQFDQVQYGDGSEPRVDVHRLDLRTWRAEKVAGLKKAVAELAASADGRRLALVTAPEDSVASYEGRSAVEILDAADGSSKALPDELWRAKAPSPFGRLNSLAWSEDGRSLAYVIGFDGYPSEILTARWDDGRAEPTIARLDRPDGVSLHAGVDSPLSMAWRGKSGDLCFLGEEKGRVRVYAATGIGAGRSPVFRCLTPGDVCVDALSVDRSGESVAVIAGGPAALPDVALVDPAGGLRLLTDVNPHVGGWKWPKLEVVRWKGARGGDVEGILELPADAEPGKPLPLIVQLHGGPTSMWNYQRLFHYVSLQGLMSSRGYAIFSPNYRGSTGYGDSFLTDLIGHENDLEVEDILKGVDALVERHVADPDRLAVAGWSNGGYLTNCLITRTDRFKAASSGAGIAEITMEWGINDEPAFPLAFVRGLPWEKPAEYARASPVYGFGRVKTPTLFHVGADDERCPPANSRMLHRALKEYLKVPTELLVYPGESHGLGQYRSRKAKMAWDAAWFDRHVLGKEATGP